MCYSPILLKVPTFVQHRLLVCEQLMWAIVTQKFETIVESCELRNWKEALAVILTYAAGDDFNRLCG